MTHVPSDYAGGNLPSPCLHVGASTPPHTPPRVVIDVLLIRLVTFAFALIVDHDEPTERFRLVLMEELKSTALCSASSIFEYADLALLPMCEITHVGIFVKKNWRHSLDVSV